jgi:hypothetical protein
MDKKLLPSEEVARYAVAVAEQAKKEGKATDADVALAWMMLTLVTLKLKDQRGEQLNSQELSYCRRLLKLLRKKAKQAGMELEEDQ